MNIEYRETKDFTEKEIEELFYLSIGCQENIPVVL